MFRRVCLAAVAAAVLIPCSWAQTVDEIIAKNVQARGGLEKLKAVQSIKSTANMSMGQQAYDGKSAWQIMPFMGKKDPEPMSADETKEVEEMADLDGPLVDYKSKGHQVELLGKEKVEGTDAYKIKATLNNGDVQTIYIDSDSFLEIKEETKRTVRGSEQLIESSIGDYKDVDGVLFPFAMESGVKGSQEKQKLTITKIELNVPADDSIFKMPAAAPKAADTPKK